VSVGTYVLFYGLYFALGLLAYATGQLEHWPRTLATAVTALLALSAFYWWLGRLIARVSMHRTA
jgi:hypothetical protein